MTIIDDGGKITFRKENHKIVMEIMDRGGLDGSPPDGVSIYLNGEDIDELITALQEMVDSVDPDKSYEIII